MKFTISTEDGAFLVKLARKAVIYFLDTNGEILDIDPNNVSNMLKRNSGVFVTIYRVALGKNEKVVGKDLRGCIGYPYPIKPLYKAVIDVAINAAFNDPRFPPLRRDELNSVIFEVTVLTPPEEIIVNTPLEYLRKIRIGRDGLIIEKGIYRGLLLPQVPVEYSWNVEEYLMHLCLKAGLPPNAWLDREVKIYRFEGIIFTETKPNGPIIKEEIT